MFYRTYAIYRRYLIVYIAIFHDDTRHVSFIFVYPSTIIFAIGRGRFFSLSRSFLETHLRRKDTRYACNDVSNISSRKLGANSENIERNDETFISCNIPAYLFRDLSTPLLARNSLSGTSKSIAQSFYRQISKSKRSNSPSPTFSFIFLFFLSSD